MEEIDPEVIFGKQAGSKIIEVAVSTVAQGRVSALGAGPSLTLMQDPDTLPRRRILYRCFPFASHRAEAITTVHRPVAPRQEWYLGVNAALGTDRRMHLPRATIVPAAVSSLLVSAGTPASWAAAGLIREPSGSKILPFADRECKNSTTVPTCQVFV